MLILLLFVIVDVMCIFDYFLYLCCLYGSEIYLKLKTKTNTCTLYSVYRDWTKVQLYSSITGPSSMCEPNISTGNEMLGQWLTVEFYN